MTGDQRLRGGRRHDSYPRPQIQQQVFTLWASKSRDVAGNAFGFLLDALPIGAAAARRHRHRRCVMLLRQTGQHRDTASPSPTDANGPPNLMTGAPGEDRSEAVTGAEYQSVKVFDLECGGSRNRFLTGKIEFMPVEVRELPEGWVRSCGRNRQINAIRVSCCFSHGRHG